jgi:hypothetical protein
MQLSLFQDLALAVLTIRGSENMKKPVKIEGINLRLKNDSGLLA